jgi:hypothetical protein
MDQGCKAALARITAALLLTVAQVFGRLTDGHWHGTGVARCANGDQGRRTFMPPSSSFLLLAMSPLCVPFVTTPTLDSQAIRLAPAVLPGPA